MTDRNLSVTEFFEVYFTLVGVGGFFKGAWLENIICGELSFFSTFSFSSFAKEESERKWTERAKRRKAPPSRWAQKKLSHSQQVLFEIPFAKARRRLALAARKSDSAEFACL